MRCTWHWLLLVKSNIKGGVIPKLVKLTEISSFFPSAVQTNPSSDARHLIFAPFQGCFCSKCYMPCMLWPICELHKHTEVCQSPLPSKHTTAHRLKAQMSSQVTKKGTIMKKGTDEIWALHPKTSFLNQCYLSEERHKLFKATAVVHVSPRTSDDNFQELIPHGAELLVDKLSSVKPRDFLKSRRL